MDSSRVQQIPEYRAFWFRKGRYHMLFKSNPQYLERGLEEREKNGSQSYSTITRKRARVPGTDTDKVMHLVVVRQKEKRKKDLFLFFQ